MGIQTYKTAYYFPTTKALEKFILLNEDKIEYANALKCVYRDCEIGIYFYFFKIYGVDKLDWLVYSKEDVITKNFRVIVWGEQRSE